MSPDIVPAAPTAEILFEDLEPELAATRRMLERYPDGKGDWRPHPKSGTLSEVASHVAGLPWLGAAILETDEMDVSERKRSTPVDSAAELLSRYDALVEKLKAALAGIGLEALEAEWTFRAGDKVFIQARRRSVLRRMLVSHMIHHRAQLGVYYRLLDVPVPGMYGPSADEAVAG